MSPSKARWQFWDEAFSHSSERCRRSECLLWSSVTVGEGSTPAHAMFVEFYAMPLTTASVRTALPAPDLLSDDTS
jgi:hypothetical protein